MSMNKGNGNLKPKRKKRYTSIKDLPEEVQRAIENMKVSYTVTTVAEYIHPDVRARLEEQKKQNNT